MNTMKHTPNTPFHTWRAILCTLIIVFPLAFSLQAKGAARIKAKANIHDFGTVVEQEGPVSHTFAIHNTGTKPLVLTRITASCGCTRPEWKKAPIAPGDSSSVIVSYNPKGRPGPFYKTIHIYSNAQEGTYVLGVKGKVVPEPAKPKLIYPYKIGSLKFHTKKVLYSTIHPEQSKSEQIHLLNDTQAPITMKIGTHPDFLTMETQSETIEAGEKGMISMLLDAKAIKKKGRIVVEVPITIKTKGKKDVKQNIRIAANVIDNFSKLKASDRKKAPVCQISSTIINFGDVSKKKISFHILSGKESRELKISNEGKTPLKIYSISCDDEVVSINGGKREIEPGETGTYKVMVKTKLIKTRMETLVCVVSNDPAGPVRLIKVSAHK